MQRSILVVLGLLAVLSLAAPVYAQEVSFDAWLIDFKKRARDQDIPQRVIDEALANITEDEEVVRLDRKQPENKIDLTRYLKNTVTKRRIEIGREMLVEHKELLDKISAKYGVQPAYIVALWGIETDYGNQMGNFSVVQSLATLAYEGRRAAFFDNELMAALKIMDKESIAVTDLVGSWAGAMGNCQFMPSTYLNFAVDGDGDGKRDIWNSPADTFASVANYLHSLGWDAKQGWGGAVKVPHGFKLGANDLKRGKTATSWHKQGLSYRDLSANPLKGQAMLYAIHPGSPEKGIFLVTENYKALLQWNRSRYFATAVGTLADAIGE